jgi:hypothetical protein
LVRWNFTKGTVAAARKRLVHRVLTKRNESLTDFPHRVFLTGCSPGGTNPRGGERTGRQTSTGFHPLLLLLLLLLLLQIAERPLRRHSLGPHLHLDVRCID